MLTPQQALQQYFGFDEFRPGQAETIQRALDGHATLLVMPTGSGKSLTYQLPALLLPGLTLVISPLIALMQDQVDRLVEAGLPATFLNSSLPTAEINRRLRAVREGQVKLLYIAPERLRQREFTRVLANLKVSLLAVDEAHCISQWGHDFRPDYLQIGPTWQAMGQPTLLATTATATPAVQQDIIRLLGVQSAQTIVTGFNRPNLTFRVTTTPDGRAKLQALRALLAQVNGSVIIYTATRRNTDEVADFVRAVAGLPVDAYHAGLDRDTRHRVQTDFMAGRLKVIVATNAFGMGVDKADVRAVIHYNLPATIEAYYQEAGRAGRDGQPAECVLLFAPDDQRLQEWLINSDTPTYQELSQVHHRLAQAANEGEVYFAQRELAELTGLHPVTLRVTLSELEQAGALFHLGDQSGYSRWKVFSLPQAALQERAAAIQRRAQIRLNLLGRMLDYAYLTSCRRTFLLNYFGDASPPESPRCCDNHREASLADLPPAVTPQEWLPLIVLDTVRSFQQRPLGRKRLAQLLTGSRAKGMAEFGYSRHRFYGKLGALSQPQVTGLIDALISKRYLRLTGGELPVVTITPAGQQALEARVALPVHVSGLALGQETGPLQPETPTKFKQPLNPAQISTAALYTTASQPDSSAADVILDAVAKLGGTLGRTGLAQLLTGSKASWLATFDQHSAYGRLSALSQPAVLQIIDALITDGKLLTTGGNRPKLILPEQKLPSAGPSVAEIEPSTASPPPPNSPASLLDPTLLETLRAWRTEQARTQQVPPYVIFANKVLEAIAVQQPTTLTELGQIAGIGPAKLEQYGAAVLELVAAPRPDQIEVESPPPSTIAESIEPGFTASQPLTPTEVIMTVVADLDGLLTVDGLAQLLTAAPDEIVSFSDQPHFAIFHGVFSAPEMRQYIQQTLDTGMVTLNRHHRLVLPE